MTTNRQRTGNFRDPMAGLLAGTVEAKQRESPRRKDSHATRGASFTEST